MTDLAGEIDRLRAYAAIAELPSAWGEALGSGRLRQHPEDFFVSEYTGLDLSGTGEHLYVRVRKTGQNTRWVAKQLAEFADIAYKSVSYAGLKDRHAVTEQWFSMQIPGRSDPDWTNLAIEGVEVLESCRHDRKLRQGQLSYNRFRLRLRDCRISSLDDFSRRIEQVQVGGVPNYFGAQRFGRSAGNLDLSLRGPDLRRLNRESRSFAISALRSALFNGYLASRVEAGNWATRLEGEALLSDRPRGVAEQDESAFKSQRLPAGVLWGKTYGGCGGEVRALEEAYFGGFEHSCAMLERAGARLSRRVMCARVADLQWRYDKDQLEIGFVLGPGVFATVLLRELLATEDCALAMMEPVSSDQAPDEKRVTTHD